MSKARPLPDLEFLHECFDLKEDGRLIWKVRPRHHFRSHQGFVHSNRRYAGNEAGTVPRGQKYRRVLFGDHGQFPAHRIVWALHHNQQPSPDLDIDHIDGNSLNNTPSNLRLVSITTNLRNSKISKRNKSGVTGVSLFNGRWHANIGSTGGPNGRIKLGSFKRKEDAIAARKVAEVRLGYHQNHGRKDRSDVP